MDHESRVHDADAVPPAHMNAEDASPRGEARRSVRMRRPPATRHRFATRFRQRRPHTPLSMHDRILGSRNQPHSHRSPRNRVRFVRRFGQLRNRKLPSLRHLRMRLPHVLFPHPHQRRLRLVLRKYPLHQNLPHHKPRKRLSRMYRRDGIVFHIRHIRRRI